MSDGPRTAPVFYASAALAVAGAIAALIGTQLPWERMITPGRTVQSEEGSFRFPDEIQTFDADDLGAGTTPLATGLAAAAVLPLLIGPRLRPVNYVGVIVLGASVFGSAVAGSGPDPAEMLASGPGRLVTMVGGVVAMASALVAVGPSSGVPRIRIPERPPGTPSED